MEQSDGVDVRDGRYRVVVIGSSLGGVEALQVVLGRLRAELPVPVLVVQHRAVRGGPSPRLFERASPMRVVIAVDGAVAEPGLVYVCPGGSVLRLEPDGTLTVQPHGRPSSLGTVDELLRSAAASTGAATLAVILSGLGSDGTAGARAVKDAGGTVVVQDELSSTAFGMPGSVIDAGLSDLVLPLADLPAMLERVLGEGRALPLPSVLAAEAVFEAGGEMGALMADTDWSRFPVGPVAQWPPALRAAVALALACEVPMNVLWGRDLVSLYNDAYRRIIGSAHPAALGCPLLDARPEHAPTLRSVLLDVWDTGRAVLRSNVRTLVRRDGRDEDLFVTASYSPLREGASIVGILETLIDCTEQVRANRRLDTLRRLAGAIGHDGTVTDVVAGLVATLDGNRDDLPFTLVYLTDSVGTELHLAARSGLNTGQPAAPPHLSVRDARFWPVAAALRGDGAVDVEDLARRFPGLACPGTAAVPERGLVLPAGRRPDGVASVVVIVGLNPRIPFDAAYRSFAELVAEQIGAVVTAARQRDDSRERLRAQAALDRSRKDFFAGVSHEFRSPLTLLLLPLEQLLDTPGLPPDEREQVRLAHRNALRLLKLVNTLLEYSQLERGATAPRIEQVDLAELTADIAGVFRPAIERAGLTYDVDCPPLDRTVPVDADMWETVVLNLVANALKHTFTGSIGVSVRLRSHHAELTVADTGVGIEEDEIPHIFERFHRGRPARARSHEGSGIGLALVDQLVHLHHGTVRVRSTVDEGSQFTVWVPLTQRWRRSEDETGADPEARLIRRRAFAEEADLWLEGDRPVPPGMREAAPPAPALPGHRPRVLLVDENADLRTYVGRLLADRYDVVAVGDGRRALDALGEGNVDLILADVTMPQIDGLELVHHVRTDPRTRATPVILLTALGSTDPTVSRLAAGAHDYIVKPFTARELTARIDAQLALARLREVPAMVDLTAPPVDADENGRPPTSARS